MDLKSSVLLKINIFLKQYTRSNLVSYKSLYSKEKI